MFPKFPREAKAFGEHFLMILVGGLAIIVGLLSYPAILSRFPVLALLQEVAYANLLLTLIGILTVMYGLRTILRTEAFRIRTEGGPPSSVFSTIAFVVSDRVFARISNLSAIAYGLLYAFVSGAIVYQPWLNFSEAYGARIPSAVVAVCCGSVGQFPQFLAYLTQHWGVLITPLNLILLFIMSWLVGINTSLTLFAYRMRPQDAGRRWYTGFGAFVGLFAGCPSCSGLMFTAIIGWAGALSVITALASLQTFFIAVSIPVLLVAPVLTSRNLVKTLSGECPVPEYGTVRSQG